MPAISIEAALQLATFQFRMGQWAAAEATCRKILAAQPDHSGALGQLEQIRSRLQSGEQSAQDPQIGLADLGEVVRLGNALMDQGRLDDAVAAFRRALEIDPKRPEVHYNLGNVHVRRSDWDEAIACYRTALTLRPGYQKAISNLGVAYLDQNRVAEAFAQFEQLSESPERHYNLGVAFSRSNRREEAIACFQQATTLNSRYAEAWWALSSELFLRGSFEKAWRLLARHGVRPDRATSRLAFHTAKWDGSPMAAGSLLVFEEQGIGDAIQFLRYLPILRRAVGGADIILECPPPLSRLVKETGGFAASVVDRGALLPPHDRHISSFDLPFLLQQWEPLAMDAPYLRASQDARNIWREKFAAAGDTLRVGLAWAGNREHQTDRQRSIPAERLLPLLHIPGATFYSLQVAPNDGRPGPLLAAGLENPTAGIRDIADTAALVAELDLVISVDTAMAHLAGALGRPVWTLLPFAPDWRWGLRGEYSAWYPTMRLFRQPALGEWEAVIHRVFEELATLARRRKVESGELRGETSKIQQPTSSVQ